MAAAREILPKDARVFQILFLALLLTTGVLLRDFRCIRCRWPWPSPPGWRRRPSGSSASASQQRGFMSAIVTCCGLSLLLRSDTLWAHPLVAALAMSSKFVLRIHGKHLYNPANLGVIAAITLIPGTWVSPGQWGNDLALAVWLLMLGTIVTTARTAAGHQLGVSRRVSGAGRAADHASWPIVGDLVAPARQRRAAAVYFFMISDPMTIPNRRGPRIAYALIVAAAAIGWQYLLFRPNALIWALFLATPLVPLLDRLFPGEGFSWRPTLLRACATSGTPPTAVAEGSAGAGS